MNKLLLAEFIRLFKSRIFKLCMLFSLGSGVFVVMMRWWDVKSHPVEYAELGVEYSNADGLIFIGVLYLMFAMSILIGLFVGTEYSEGTIRNKLIVGHTRENIYLSKLMVCAAADIMIYILYILVVLVLGEIFINGTTMKASEILFFTLADTAAVLAITALLLVISMSVQNKAAGSICLLTTLIMFFATLTIAQRLSAPEYYDDYVYVDQDTGEVITEKGEKNSHYLTGTKREVYEFLNNFLPASQMYQIAMNISDNLGVIAVYDCVLIIITTGTGLIIFKKKNLK